MISPPNRAAALWTTLHGILWVVPTLTLAVLMPRFLKTFTDYGLDLSGTTLLAVKVAGTIMFAWPIVLGALAILLGIDFAGTRIFLSRREDRETARLWIATMTALPLCLWLFSAVAIGLPLLELRRKIAG